MPESILTRERRAQFPIYVRIVPKDVWLRFHISSGQTIASIKDAALNHARAPEHDPTHSVRFYLDAADATLNAKQALAAGNAQMTKQRNNSLPTVFTTPLPADLAPTLIKNAASFSSTASPRQNLISLPHRAALSALASHWSPGKTSSNLANVDKRKAQNSELYQPISGSPSRRLPRELASSPSARAMSAYDPLTSVHSRTTTSSLPSSDEGSLLDTSIVRGNLHAKQEEQRAQALLLQWSQSNASLQSIPQEYAEYNGAGRSPQSPHKTPTLGSAAGDPSFRAAADMDDDDSIAYGTHTLAPEADYGPPSITSHDETVSNASSDNLLLVTSDRSGAKWGTQAEDLLPHTELSPNANAFADARPRSRTVTAADAQAGPSTANDATLRPRGRLVPETAQRREVSQDLMHMFSKSERGVVRPASPSTTLVDADAEPAKAAEGKNWTDRGRLASLPAEDVAHPLSKRFAVLSSTTGCVMEDWKTAAACKIRPFDMVQLQWFVPTERVYTPCFTADFVREAARDSLRGPHPESDLLEPYYEGWVYMLEEGLQPGKQSEASKRAAANAARLNLATWKLRWITVKGWRLDMYRQRPRAGEISLPPSDSIWPLLAIQRADVAESPIAANALMPALETLHGSSISISFSPLPVSAGPGEVTLTAAAPSLTLRCISRFEHEALYKLFSRAQTRVAWRAQRGAGTLRESELTDAVDRWRRQALFRALVAGRGGTVGGTASRNAKARAHLRPNTWKTRCEDADQWSSASETEDDGGYTPHDAGQLGLVLR